MARQRTDPHAWSTYPARMNRDRIEGKRNRLAGRIHFVAAVVLALLAALAAPPALPQNMAPDILIRTVTLEVLDIIRHDKGIQDGDPAKVADLVELKILPHFDFARMTQLAVALNWRLATAEQQAALTSEFRTLLVRTYSTALSAYRNQVIEFRPLRGAPAEETTVRSMIRRSGTASTSMDYDMERLPAGWKVYDIKIDGMSLVTTYRDTFASMVREDGIDGLIRALADKNRLGDARFRAHKTGDFHIPALLIHAAMAWQFYISHSR